MRPTTYYIVESTGEDSFRVSPISDRETAIERFWPKAHAFLVDYRSESGFFSSCLEKIRQEVARPDIKLQINEEGEILCIIGPLAVGDPLDMVWPQSDVELFWTATS